MASSRAIAILGAGGHALSVFDAAVSAGFNPVAFVDPLKVGVSLSLPVVATLSDLGQETKEIALGIGANFLRERAYFRVIEETSEYKFPPIIHRSAWVAPSASIGAGAVILSMASVGADCTVGVGAVINTSSSLDHSSELLEFASLGPGAHTGGDVRIGERSFVGLNAGIFPGVTVGSDSVIGAHSMLSNDVASFSVLRGVPAALTRQRTRDEPYL